MNKTLRDRFVIKDDILYVPEWEWNSGEEQILGFRLIERQFLVAIRNDGFLVGFTFENDWTLYVSLYARRNPNVLVVWDYRDDSDDNTPEIYVESLDRLLGCIRTIAERPARKEADNG